MALSLYVCLHFLKSDLSGSFEYILIRISRVVISTFKFLIIDIEGCKQNAQALILS